MNKKQAIKQYWKHHIYSVICYNLQMTKLTVIVPVYNPPLNMFYSSIKSYAEQRLNIEYELLLIDDGSNEETQKAIKSLEEQYKNIKSLRQINKGASAARNLGIENLNTNEEGYYAFFDADDYLKEDSLQKIIDIFKENKNTDIVSFGYKEKHISVNRPSKIITKPLTDRIVITNKTEYADKYFNGYPWNSIFRINPKEKIPLYDESLHFFEDKIWKIERLKNSKEIIVIPDIFYTYNIHSSSISHNREKALQTQYEKYLGMEETIEKIKLLGKEATANQIEIYLNNALNDYFYWKLNYKDDKSLRKCQIQRTLNIIKRIIGIIPRKDLRQSYTKNNFLFLYLWLLPNVKKAKQTNPPVYMNTKIEFAKEIFGRK